MTTMVSVDRLRSDLTRWQSQLTEVSPTHMQGIASKASKEFEGLLKRLAEHRITVLCGELSLLLDQVGYKGDARTVAKLPLGTVTDLLRELTKQDVELAQACPPDIHEALRALPEARNYTTHELAGTEMRGATERLLDLIQHALDHDPLRHLLQPQTG